MLTTLSSSQMLDVWRSCAGLEPLLDQCSVTRFDGVDIDSWLRPLMRRWYLDYLDGLFPGIPRPVVKAAGLLSLELTDADGPQASVSADPSVRTVLSLRLSGWSSDAFVASGADAARALVLMSNPFSRPGAASPLAWLGDDDVVRVAPADSSSRIVAALAVVDPGPDTYIFDDRALSHISDYLQNK